MDNMTSKYPLKHRKDREIKERTRVERSREMKTRANLKKGHFISHIYMHCTHTKRCKYRELGFCVGIDSVRAKQV